MNGAFGYVNALCHLINVLQRPLNSIKNSAHDSRSKLYRQGFACSQNGVAHGDAGGVLVHLNGGQVAFQTNDFTHLKNWQVFSVKSLNRK